MISYAPMEQRLKAQYQIRLMGSKLVFRQGQGGPFRDDPTLLANFVKNELSRRDFGGQGYDHSGLWHSGLVETFKQFIAIDCPVLCKRTEEYTSIPSTTTKHLIKE